MEDEQQQPEQMMPESTPPPSEAPHPTRRERRHHKKMLLLFIGGGVLLVLLAAFAAYWFLLRGDKPETAKPSTSQSSKKQVAAPVADPTPVSFKSTKLNIEITHRKDWTLKESTDGEITITSPQTSYTKADGRATTGVFTVKFRKGVTDTMKATIDKAIATRDSEVIGYAAPTEAQRQYTNISYGGGQKDVFNFFVVTGSTAFKAGAAFAYTLPLDGEFYLITGGYGVPGSNLAYDSVAKTAIDTTTVEQAIAIVESLKIF